MSFHTKSAGTIKSLNAALFAGDSLSIDTGFEDAHRVNPTWVPDMTSLPHIHEPGILHNLSERDAAKRPYTYMGTGAMQSSGNLVNECYSIK